MAIKANDYRNGDPPCEDGQIPRSLICLAVHDTTL